MDTTQELLLNQLSCLQQMLKDCEDLRLVGGDTEELAAMRQLVTEKLACCEARLMACQDVN